MKGKHEMIKVDIFSGFLGAGKTTMIKKLIEEAYQGEKVVLIENEFGEIGIDGGFLKDSGIQINEMNAGCICCSLVGNFSDALQKVAAEFSPDRILIEPSGVGKLSDIVEAVESLHMKELRLNGIATVVDAKKAKSYMKNFGEFYNNQVEHASAIILSHTKDMDESKLQAVTDILREHNDHATIITTDWDLLDGKKILEAVENKEAPAEVLKRLEKDYKGHKCCGKHGHHHDHDEHDCGEHKCKHAHHHEDGEHHHHHHHHAEDVFNSVGFETGKKFTADFIKKCLETLGNTEEYGQVLRAKGIVDSQDGQWIFFDYVPGEPDVRKGSPEVTGRIAVIGTNVEKEQIKKLFGI